MEQFDLYQDMAKRTGGDIYIGVVGPVRSGKSTFIKRFMELRVLPQMDDENEKTRTTDELPQSASGTAVMTTQPKFVPGEAATIRLDEHTAFRVRLVDCVGYLIDGVTDNRDRMVHTPWSEEEIPFARAAEIGTQKVIRDHSTIGVVVTTDGSFTEIPRENYAEAEERVIRELQELGKPFVVLLNTNDPDSVNTQKLQYALEEKYGVPVVPQDVLNMSREDIDRILEQVLLEFPLKQICIRLPQWVRALPADHELIGEIIQCIDSDKPMEKMRDYEGLIKDFTPSDNVTGLDIDEVLLGKGEVITDLSVNKELFYQILSEACGCTIKGDYHLIALMQDLIKAKKEYDKLARALQDVEETGFGIVPPSMEDMTLEEPQIVKKGSHFGVKLRASAPSLHLMRVNIRTTVNPLVGSEKQSEELVNYLMSEFENDPQKIWDSNLFGKSLHALVMEGLETKLNNISPEARRKLQKTMERIVNDGSGGLICILL